MFRTLRKVVTGATEATVRVKLYFSIKCIKHFTEKFSAQREFHLSTTFYDRLERKVVVFQSHFKSRKEREDGNFNLSVINLGIINYTHVPFYFARSHLNVYRYRHKFVAKRIRYLKKKSTSGETLLRRMRYTL